MKNNDNPERNIDSKTGDTVNLAEQESGELAVGEEGASQEIEKLKADIQDLKDKYLRQIAEFDNFKKRNARERLELIQTAGKDVIVSLLEIMDDCDRGEKQIQDNQELGNIKEGIQLIFNKLRAVLQSKGVKAMQSIGSAFDPDQHEAITEVPVSDPELRGKVIDEVEKGYYLNEKIIRFAKVVVGK